ncbi:hypothetical protein [Caudoviricetes sp.]|nr:hypothetical protein [Caudoviricetes sp.]
MSQSRTAAANATLVLAHTGENRIKNIQVRQRTFDAPVLHLQMFNAVAPTVGTTAPTDVIQIPAGREGLQHVDVKAIFAGKDGGKRYGTALSYAVTTTHDGSTAPDAGDEPEVIINYEPLTYV